MKVGKCKMPGQIPNGVTALISEQFSESRLDDSSLAKLGKRILQKAEADLEPWHVQISSHMGLIWASYTIIYPHIPSYTLIYLHIPSYVPHIPSYTLIYLIYLI